MHIDLNCDLGEWKNPKSRQNDEKIMPYISSCNIACGGHIGDVESMRTTINLAKKHQVAVGLHPSYPDKENFGRMVMDISTVELTNSLIAQIQQFKEHVDDLGTEIHHVKPHGALYNYAAKDKATAEIFINSMKETDLKVPIYTLPNCVLKSVAEEHGFRCINEVFADRAYDDSLNLRSRSKPEAVLTTFRQVQAHIHRMVIEGVIKTYSGKFLPISAETICLHSDTDGALQLARQINHYLKDHGCTIVAS